MVGGGYQRRRPLAAELIGEFSVSNVPAGVIAAAPLRLAPLGSTFRLSGDGMSGAA